MEQSEARSTRLQAEDEALIRRWEGLPDDERERRLQLARAALKMEPRWSRIPPEVREQETKARALRNLRSELAAGDNGKGLG